MRVEDTKACMNLRLGVYTRTQSPQGQLPRIIASGYKAWDNIVMHVQPRVLVKPHQSNINMNMEKSTLPITKEDLPHSGYEEMRSATIHPNIRVCGFRVPRLAVFPVLAVTFMLWVASTHCTLRPRSLFSEKAESPQHAITTWHPKVEVGRSLVPLEAHIMSKCPVSIYCRSSKS